MEQDRRELIDCIAKLDWQEALLTHQNLGMTTRQLVRDQRTGQ
jgi:hypothetical protein